MYEDRNSKKSQEAVIADILRDRYLNYYRQLAEKLKAKTEPVTETPLPASPPPTPVSPPKTMTVDYSQLVPGYTVSHTYSLAGMGEVLKSPIGLLLLSAVGYAGYKVLRS